MSNANIGNFLMYLREQSNLSQSELASRIGISKTSISKWEDGQSISIDNLYRLSKFYNISFDELYRGRRENESIDIYYKRNYDLTSFNLENDFENKKYDRVIDFFTRCMQIKNKFFNHVQLWCDDCLSDELNEEFKFIKNYFSIDWNYYNFLNNKNITFQLFNEMSEKKFLKEYLSNYNSNEEKNWELNKIYNFKYDVSDINKFISCDNDKIVESVILMLNQIEKDKILSSIINLNGSNVIEITTIIKILIKNNANVLYQFKPYPNGFDDEMFNQLEGKVTRLECDVYNKYLFYDFSGRHYIPILENWKQFSFKDYQEFIDKATTNYLKNKIDLKEKNPLKYFSFLKNQ